MRKKTPQNRRKTGRKPNGQFAPGASGNPGGRPKTRRVSEAARNWLASEYARAPHISNAEALVEFLGAQAFGGDVSAARELIDRAEGKAKQSIDVDMTMMDWRDQARQLGLNIDDVIAETRRLLDAVDSDRNAESDGDAFIN
jgi:hypothetical protein